MEESWPIMEETWPRLHQSASSSEGRKLTTAAIRDIAAAFNALIADLFALYLKTRNFHWHIPGESSDRYRSPLGQQAAQILTSVELLATRVRELGATTLRSVSHVARLQRVLDNDADYVEPAEMIAELSQDNLQVADRLRRAHELCEDQGDFDSIGLVDKCADEAERRASALLSIGHDPNSA
jgi:starvation-inducible DNA-binding protein